MKMSVWRPFNPPQFQTLLLLLLSDILISYRVLFYALVFVTSNLKHYTSIQYNVFTTIPAHLMNFLVLQYLSFTLKSFSTTPLL